MDWFLVSSLNAALSVISLAILLISMRKMARSLRSSAELDQKLDKATQGLDQGLDRAIAALRQEHQHLNNQSKQIEAKIKQATLVRAQIDKSLAHLLQTRAQLKKELAGRTASVKQEHPPREIPIKFNGIKPISQAPVKVNGKNLPVFVMRKIKKASRADVH